ncbi:type I restriction endonuclease subunit R, EcoR124 family [Salipiger marinus]|uniref:type I restriction endonuclease subunit R, EcoR124 family n=1 Tax=Salipiger marinus TaxID=555512 RepID=UPI004059AA3E
MAAKKVDALQKKSQGNIVCFRNLKERVDEAIALFSDKEARDKILMEPYEVYVDEFNAAVMELLKITPTPSAVDRLESEDDMLAFVQAFRNLIRIKNVLTTFNEFSNDDLALDPQRFEDFKSKYLDIHDRVKSDQDTEPKASILDEVDFELELIRRDNINVAYILALLGSIAAAGDDEEAVADAASRQKAVLDILGSEERLRSKRELIEEFVASYLPGLQSEDETKNAFWAFWTRKRAEAFEELCQDEGLDADAFSALITAYQFSNKEPLTDEIMAAIKTPPGIVKRRPTARRILSKMVDYIETFDEQLGDLEAA